MRSLGLHLGSIGNRGSRPRGGYAIPPLSRLCRANPPPCGTQVRDKRPRQLAAEWARYVSSRPAACPRGYVATGGGSYAGAIEHIVDGQTTDHAYNERADCSHEPLHGAPPRWGLSARVGRES
jgi:hypothetical protein